MTSQLDQLKEAKVPNTNLALGRTRDWRMDPSPHIFDLILSGASNLPKNELEIAIRFINLINAYDKSCRRARSTLYTGIKNILIS